METNDFAAKHVEAARQSVRTTITNVLSRDVADIDARPAIVAGHYRRGRRWNCMVDMDGRPLAAVHIVAVPAKQLSERLLLTLTDEMLGRALDASKARTTDDELRSWLGHVLLIEDHPFWHELTTITDDAETTRIDRVSFFVDRGLASNLLDAAVVLLANPTTGQRTTKRPAVTEESFAAALRGRTLAFSAHFLPDDKRAHSSGGVTVQEVTKSGLVTSTPVP
jgi:hypothetical protein